MTRHDDRTDHERITGHAGLSRRSILIGGATAAVAASAAVDAVPALASPRSRRDELLVGAGRSELTIPVGTYHAEQYDDVHDPLHVRIVLVKTASASLVLVVFDLTSISEEAITGVRTAVTAVTGVVAADIIVTVTHNFSSPHVGPSTNSTDAASWIADLTDAARTAAASATAGLQKARVGFGTGRADVNVNRNLRTKDGYSLGPNEHLPSDKTVEVARFDDVHGSPIAILTNYSVQSSVVMESVTTSSTTYPYEVSADLAGAASAWVENAYSGVVAPFLVGATGDQQPAFRSLHTLIDRSLTTSTEDAGRAGWTLLKVQGERLGTEIVRVAETISTAVTGELRLVQKTLTVNTVATTQGQQDAPTTTHAFTVNGTTPLSIWVFRIGDGVFAGTPPELSTSTLLDIRRHSPFRHTFVMSMFEGGEKNMPDRWNYEHITYEALDGQFAPGSAERFAAYTERLIRGLA